MKNNIYLSAILMLLTTLIFTGCSKNESLQSFGPSPRDGVYEGENLTVTIDGETATSIKSVRVFSRKIPYAQETIGYRSIEGKSLEVYNTSLIIDGFPGSNEEVTLETVSNIYYFDGVFNISLTDGVQYYEFIGTFTGNPDSPRSVQGLILEFNLIENP